MSKGGYSDCLAISFSTGHYAKQCHAFQSKSSREVSHMVMGIGVWGVGWAWVGVGWAWVGVRWVWSGCEMGRGLG